MISSAIEPAETLNFAGSGPTDPLVRLATAVLAGAVGAMTIPTRWVARLLPDLLWLVPVVLIFAAVMYERRWFM